jgi:hypothetical protein
VCREQPRRANTRIQDSCPARSTWDHIKTRRGIDRASIDDHPKIQVWAICKAAAADRGDPLAAINRLATLRQKRRNQAKVAVYADESVVLNKDLETSDAMPLNPDDRARSHCDHWGPECGRKVNPLMEGSGQWPIW